MLSSEGSEPQLHGETGGCNRTDMSDRRSGIDEALRRSALPLAIGLLGALLIAGLTRPKHTDMDPQHMSDWDPTLASLRRVIPAGPVTSGDPRVEEFNRRLTGRYRQRLLAVRVILQPPDRIELRCGANIPRRLMARIAVQTESDARALFGRPFDVDVYETYVAAPKRKIAELRTNGPGGQSTLRFDERRWSEWPRETLPRAPGEPATRAR